MKQNLVYLLTNTNKTEGKRFYIGSKQEASLEEFDGVMTILDRLDKPYYSSTTSIEMKEEMIKGDVFEASILEIGVDRKDLIFRENFYIEKYNAVLSEEFYNKSNALMNCHDQDAVANKFGETVKELACRNSSCSKRDNTARKLNFDNFGELHLWVKEKKDEGLTHAEMSTIIGKHRHFTASIIEGINLDKAKLEIDNKDLYQDKLRRMVAAGCSLYYAAEILGLELPSARIILGDYNKEMERAFRTAIKAGLSKDELERKVVQYIYDADENGSGWREAAKACNITSEAARRYFVRYVKANMPRPE